MTTQPNKPGGDFREDGKVRPEEDVQAVRNQGTTTPKAYPDNGQRSTGDQAIGGEGVPKK